MLLTTSTISKSFAGVCKCSTATSCYWMESAGIHLEGLAYVICNKYPCSECLESFFLSTFFLFSTINIKKSIYSTICTTVLLTECVAHNLEKGQVFQLFHFPNFFLFLIFSQLLLIPTLSALLFWC